MNSRGLFVTLEGIEGSGKSSLIQSLATWLGEKKIRHRVTREPGGTVLGKKVRELLLHSTEEPISETSELLLFSADRAQHVAQVIHPALSRGELVLCDRYVHSTFAYQGAARGIARNVLDALFELSAGSFLPDLVLLLDLPPEVGLGRAKVRSHAESDEKSWSRFEEEKLSFHTAVRTGFLALAQEDPKRFLVLDASQSQETVFQKAREGLESRL